MATRDTPHLFCLLILACSLDSTNGDKWSYHSTMLNRSSFPAGFVFGAGTSAYQIEGAASEDGRGPSIWDTFTHKHPEKIQDHSTGDVADGFYRRYKEDILLIKKIGVDAFRFSISWSRILPKGKISGGVNLLGVQFYNNLINDLLSNGLQPYVTLFHWDLPQALDDDYGGFLSPKIVGDYVDYVDFCFTTFGDRVKHWITLNEPYDISVKGYATGVHAPGRCSNHVGNCTSGNSATEPYVVGHNLILSHATAVKLYREKYKASQKGQIGIVLSSYWFVPFSKDAASQKAALRGLDFMLGWFLHPLTYGDYPHIMRSLVGHRLPKFTKSESQMLKNSYDFLGLNYYTSYYAADGVLVNVTESSMTIDSHVRTCVVRRGVPIGQPTTLSWIYICPEGIWALTLYIKDKYGDPPIIITENGLGEAHENLLPVEEWLEDELRITYHYDHLTYVLKAIKEGADVKGYFLWSSIDNFEWAHGFTVRFGITYVDYKNGLRRYPKDSAIWFNKFLQGENVISRSSTFQFQPGLIEREPLSSTSSYSSFV